MKKCFQVEWQGIRFSDFSNPSPTSLAGPAFYDTFYKVLFSRYARWEDLPLDWRQEKELWARFVLGRIEKGAEVLSVGCGLGAMEHYMRTQRPDLHLSIHEMAPSAWHWISEEFPEGRKFLGAIPDCLPQDRRFDLAYLSTVDYALDDDALIELLSSLRKFLGKPKRGGRCLLISATFEDIPSTTTESLISSLYRLRSAIATILTVLGLRNPGQFWGWRRTRAEYVSIMRRAGYQAIEDGFVCPEQRAHYWISGS